MEKEKNKKLSIILIGVSIGLVISIAGILVYKFYPRSDEVRKNGTVTKQLEIKHTNEDAKTNTNDKVVLDEEDVKKWLEDNQLIERYFILKEKDFDYKTADIKDYSNIISTELVYGSIYNSEILDSKELSRIETGYDYQYTYSLDFVKKVLKDYFNVGIEKIDVNVMNEINKEIGNYSIKDNTFVVKNRLYAENWMDKEITKISLENDGIIIQYKVIMHGAMPEYDVIKGYREIVLKKTDTGYNLLKAYKVEN